MESNNGLTTAQQNVLTWCEALESGKYTQCKDTLFDGTGYCCIGVLERLFGNPEQLDDVFRHASDKLFTGIPLSMCASEAIGFDAWDQDRKYMKYAIMNDEGKPFKEIAREIRIDNGLPLCPQT